jgi:hypothetical protein
MLNAYATIAAAVAFPMPGKVASVSGSAGEEHLASGCTGKALEVRKLFEKFPVLHGNPLDLCLLEHDLRDEDPVGVGGPPPGEIAAVGAVVGEDEVPEEPDGLLGDPLLKDRFEEPAFAVVLVGVEGADHTIILSDGEK